MKKGILIGAGIGTTIGIAIGAGIATIVIKRDVKKAEEKRVDTILKLKDIVTVIVRIYRGDIIDFKKLKEDIQKIVNYDLSEIKEGSKIYDAAVVLENHKEKGVTIHEASYRLEERINEVIEILRNEKVKITEDKKDKKDKKDK